MTGAIRTAIAILIPRTILSYCLEVKPSAPRATKGGYDVQPPSRKLRDIIKSKPVDNAIVLGTFLLIWVQLNIHD